MNVLTFDIETVPDVAIGRRLYELEKLSDEDVARIMFQKRREQTGDSDFLRHHHHRIVAISVVLRSDAQGSASAAAGWTQEVGPRRERSSRKPGAAGEPFLGVWSLGETTSDEAELIRRFYDGIEKYTPTLVSWNGGGFDLPVLHYRSLLHGVSAPRYWDTGDDDREFRFNNYLSRYHTRHSDLMDVLSGYQPRATAPLDEIALMLGLPGKMGQSGANVWDRFRSGQIEQIRNYCETDVLNTYLIYLRWELLRGHLDEAGWRRETRLVRDTLKGADKPHLNAFLSAWPG